MAKEEIGIKNFSGGELSSKMYGRFELAIYKNGCRRMENFIAETQGPARYRTGTRYVHNTRRNNVANLILFEFNDVQAYQLEFTDGFLRFYRDEGILTFDPVALTDITQANPGVVTSTGHGLANGDEVFLESVVGMIEVNGRSFVVANVGANDFELNDNDGNPVDTSGFTAYSSGGVFKKIVEIVSPYLNSNDLFALDITQNADVAYITHPFYEPRKLTRTSATNFTLVRYDRIDDPFLDEKVITAITQASPAVVTSNSHGFSNGNTVIIEEVVGMVEINSQPYKLKNVTTNTFELTDLNDVDLDTTGFTAYGSAGFASNQNLLPSAVTFYESRLWFGGPDEAPDRFFGSRSPEGAGDPNPGDPRFDDFTLGSDPDFSVVFTIADAEVNNIRWLRGTDRLLFAGTFGTEVKITGETLDAPIAPDSIAVRAENRLGVADIRPVNKENIVIYVQRGKRTLRSFEFDALADSFISVDRNLVSEEITEGIFKQLTWQSGRPNVLWAVLENGELLGLTFKSREDVSGWHRHSTKSGTDKFISVSTMSRPTGFDQIWVVVERTINGLTRHYVEYFADEALIPNRLDFFTNKESKSTDDANFQRAMAEAQKEYIHLDSSLSFDGSAVTLALGATMTPSAVTGDTVTFTSSVPIFKASDVDREIRKKALKGIGFGRAKITGFTSSTVVTCQIIQDFDFTDVIAAGNWYLTTDTLSGLLHLEGETVQVVTDGSVHTDKLITNGVITLDFQAAKVHIGLKFIGFLQPMAIEGTGTTGPGQTKNKNIYRVGARFSNTLFAEFGTDIYEPEEFVFSEVPLNVGDPTLLFTGVKTLPYSDNWEEDKIVFIRQTKPVPCIVQLLMLFMEGDNE